MPKLLYNTQRQAYRSSFCGIKQWSCQQVTRGETLEVECSNHTQSTGSWFGGPGQKALQAIDG